MKWMMEGQEATDGLHFVCLDMSLSFGCFTLTGVSLLGCIGCINNGIGAIVSFTLKGSCATLEKVPP